MDHLSEATDRWQQAGAFDPAASMRREVGVVVNETLTPGTLREVLYKVVERISTDARASS
jgi:hypothetical protein